MDSDTTVRDRLTQGILTAAWVKTRTVGPVHTPAFPGHGALRVCPFCGEYYRRHAGFVDHRDRCDPHVPTREGRSARTESDLEVRTDGGTPDTLGNDACRIYLASSFSLKDRVQHVYNTLTDAGHRVPDIWWDESREQADLKVIDVPDDEWYRHPAVQKRAARHWTYIDATDVFVIVAPPEGTKKFNGANIELGYAIATGSACYSVGRLERSAMYEPVRQLDDAAALVDALADRFRSCSGCGEAVDTEREHVWKTASDENWWHPECHTGDGAVYAVTGGSQRGE